MPPAVAGSTNGRVAAMAAAADGGKSRGFSGRGENLDDDDDDDEDGVEDGAWGRGATHGGNDRQNYLGSGSRKGPRRNEEEEGWRRGRGEERGKGAHVGRRRREFEDGALEVQDGDEGRGYMDKDGGCGEDRESQQGEEVRWEVVVMMMVVVVIIGPFLM